MTIFFIFCVEVRTDITNNVSLYLPERTWLECWPPCWRSLGTCYCVSPSGGSESGPARTFNFTSNLNINMSCSLVPLNSLLVHLPGLLLLLHLSDVIDSLHLHSKPDIRDDWRVESKQTKCYLDMKAVSGRITLKNTSLATASVFSTVLVTRVEAYL